MWNLKRNDTNKLTKQKETHRLRKLSYGPKGKCKGKDKLEFGINIYTLHTTIYKINNQ